MAESLIVVVSYNNCDLTLRAIEALKKQTVPTRIVVWDNNSPDGSARRLAQVQGIELIASPENLMWTPAINRAIAEKWDGEPFIGYMNNDAAPGPTCIERLTNVLRDESVGLAGPVIERIGGPQDVANTPINSMVVGREQNLDQAIERLPVKRVTFVLGAFAMLRKEVWDQVGPLPEDMPLGADDHDYCIRIKHAGYQIVVVQSAYAQHAGHASSKQEGKANWDDWGGKSWQVFNEKWAGYYSTEEEAIKCHWGGDFVDGWEIGTGWGPDKLKQMGLRIL